MLLVCSLHCQAGRLIYSVLQVCSWRVQGLDLRVESWPLCKVKVVRVFCLCASSSAVSAGSSLMYTTCVCQEQVRPQSVVLGEVMKVCVTVCMQVVHAECG